MLSYGERIANFFDQSNGNIIGSNNTLHSNEAKELKHQVEKLELKLEKLQAQVELLLKK